MKYTHLFFDLDNTLWDFSSNSYDALHTALIKLDLLSSIGDYNSFFRIYHDVNEQLWTLYRDGKISKAVLRVQRFEESLEKNGTPMPGIGGKLNDTYLEEMPLKTKLVNGAKKVLDYLHGRYEMAIITNGFKEVQYDKIEQSGLGGYFKKIFISEEVGAQKPRREIFEHAIKSMNARKKNTLMIGDSWEADIVGAMDFGIDQAYYNPNKDQKDDAPPIFSKNNAGNCTNPLSTPPVSNHQHNLSINKKTITYLISDLHQLIEIL
jgi:YjjG family noncanonical pyrimidine nucleotidase